MSESAEQDKPLPRLVLGVRPPDPPCSKIYGSLSPSLAARIGVSVSCTTTFAARKADVATLDRPTPNDRLARGPLGRFVLVPELEVRDVEPQSMLKE